jgi:hypothetical protein
MEKQDPQSRQPFMIRAASSMSHWLSRSVFLGRSSLTLAMISREGGRRLIWQNPRAFAPDDISMNRYGKDFKFSPRKFSLARGVLGSCDASTLCLNVMPMPIIINNFLHISCS